MIALYVFLGFLGIVIIYLVVIIFFPVLGVEPQPIKRESTDEIIPDCRENIEYDVNGLKVKGWLYLPAKVHDLPCIVMCHGFCGTKDFALEKFALDFVDNGYAVLTFDYRYFGESEGEPRQNYCGPWQVEDTKKGIAYVRSRPEIDSNKIYIWGTSGGAPYPLLVASKDASIAGVICQVGGYDHKADNKYYIDKIGMCHFLKMFMHAQRDKGRSRFNLSPHFYPAYGRPNTRSFLNLLGTFDGIEDLAKNSKTFKNEVPGRFAVNPHPEDVLEASKNIQCNALIVVAKQDGIISPTSHIRLMDILDVKGHLHMIDTTHWGVYKDDGYKENIEIQLEFLKSIS